MKDLYSHILEMSILDIDQIDATSDVTSINLQLQSHEGPLYSYIRSGSHYPTQGTSCILHQDNTFEATVMSIGLRHDDTMKEYYHDGLVKGLKCDALYVEHIDDITPDIITNELDCNSANFQTVRSMSDINISAQVVSFDIYYNLKFKNVHIDIKDLSKQGHRLYFKEDELPDLKGLTSNAEYIEQYSFNSEGPIQFAPLFDLTYKCMVEDKDKHQSVEIPVKTMKKIIALANNNKRYGLLDGYDLFKLKPNAKLGDIIPLKNFPNLKRVLWRNNNVRLLFTKNHPSKEYLAMQYTTLARSKYRDDVQQTADGWYVFISKT